MFEKLGEWISPWIYGPAIVLLWVLVSSVIKTLFLSKIKNWAEKTTSKLDDIVIHSAGLPLTILIFASSIYFLEILLPLNKKISLIASSTAKGAVIVAFVIFFDSLIREFAKAYADRPQFGAISREVAQGVLRSVVFGLGILALLDMAGVSITPALASLGIGSLAVGLALQDTLTNFFSGVHISIDRPIRLGDFIKLESGEEGYVTEVGWRSTRIRMPNNITVIVPNHKITSSVITNYYLPDKELAVIMQAGVSYDSDLKHVEKITIEVAREIMKAVKGGIPSFEPLIRYHTFDSSSINFSVVMRAKEFANQDLIKHEFIKALHERYKREGITIPYPFRTLDIPKETLELIKSR